MDCTLHSRYALVSAGVNGMRIFWTEATVPASSDNECYAANAGCCRKR